ncbi:hypothetical protein Salat_2909900 [Sesamum alatum]|uniref:Uncharacterized protein n=1 Tax=Sesamum alatum TaxID=300844 RepID=A0AAE1XIY8_9LAMI|nr:hypothetical protein Salat_2909900 [Sesamum alatum]
MISEGEAGRDVEWCWDVEVGIDGIAGEVDMVMGKLKIADRRMLGGGVRGLRRVMEGWGLGFGLRGGSRTEHRWSCSSKPRSEREFFLLCIETIVILLIAIFQNLTQGSAPVAVMRWPIHLLRPCITS